MSQSTLIFAPHILYRRARKAMQFNGHGQVLPDTEEQWEYIGECRCDDNTTSKFTRDNGEVFISQYQVVTLKTDKIQLGDYIRCMDGEQVRGEGEVFIIKKGNYFSKMVLWI